MSRQVRRRTPPVALPALAVAGCIALAGPVSATDPQWPASPDFPFGSVVPNLYLGETHRGWTDLGGGWITDSGPHGEELWGLHFERDGAATVAIVEPESYEPDGTVESWRVYSSLLITADEDPMTWGACELASGEQQPVYARWSEQHGPSSIWTFDPEAGRFRTVAADDVVCDPYGPE